MNKIKTYEDFVNEEINLRKAAAGLALGAGLTFGSPVVGQTTNKEEKDDEVEIPTTKKIEISDKHIISGFRNYKLGDTEIYGSRVYKEKSISLSTSIRYFSYSITLSSKFPIHLSEGILVWFEKKESLFNKPINIYFGYGDNKLMCIYIEWNKYEIDSDDVLELLRIKFGKPYLDGTKNDFLVWKESYSLGKILKDDSFIEYHPDKIIGGEEFLSHLKIFNSELENYVLHEYELAPLKNKEKEEKEKAERKKKINSETF